MENNQQNNEQFMEQQKSDLAYVRTKMREIMEFLSNPTISSTEKKSMLALYNTLNNSAKITVSSCLTELAIAKITPIDYIEVNNENKQLPNKPKEIEVKK